MHGFSGFMRLLLLFALSSPALVAWDSAVQWQLDSQASTLGFGSLKAGTKLEGHRFTRMGGFVDLDRRTAQVDIDSCSADSGISIRDERMRAMLFQCSKYPTIRISADVPDGLESLAPGKSLILTEHPVSVAMNGVSADMLADLLVNRASQNTVTLTNARLIAVKAGWWGMEGGVNQLRDAAGLPSISYNVPVSFMLVFTAK